MVNPMQMMGQINQFAQSLKGDPEQMGRKAIQGMDQRQLNQLQRRTNEIYKTLKMSGIIK